MNERDIPGGLLTSLLILNPLTLLISILIVMELICSSLSKNIQRVDER